MRYKVRFDENVAVGVELSHEEDCLCGLKLSDDGENVDWCIVDCDSEAEAIETATNIVKILWENMLA